MEARAITFEIHKPIISEHNTSNNKDHKTKEKLVVLLFHSIFGL